MKKQNWSKANVLLISAFVILCNITLFAQGRVSKTRVQVTPVSFGTEIRPFDFADKFYTTNGIEPSMLLNRRNGADGLSVIDFTSEQDHNDVRIIATHTAYSPDGKTLFWNLHAEFDKNGFTPDAAGLSAFDLAYQYPIYTFPSVNRGVHNRQSPIIDTADNYFEKNELGLGIVMTVVYNDLTGKEDAAYLADLGKRNGLSVDGTPIIRTTYEIQQLILRNLISINTRGASGGEGVPFVVGKVIEYPTLGAITDDAFLVYVKDFSGKPLDSEAFFVTTFECIKSGGCK